MGQRWRHLLDEVGKFAVTGILASLVAFLLFNWFVHWSPGMERPLLADHVLSGFLVANVIGAFVSYRLARSWAFRRREPVGLASGRLSYFAISFGSMVIPTACLWVSRNVLGHDSALADNLAANVIGLFLGFVTRFLAFRHFVFVHPESSRVLSRR